MDLWRTDQTSLTWKSILNKSSFNLFNHRISDDFRGNRKSLKFTQIRLIFRSEFYRRSLATYIQTTVTCSSTTSTKPRPIENWCKIFLGQISLQKVLYCQYNRKCFVSLIFISTATFFNSFSRLLLHFTSDSFTRHSAYVNFSNSVRSFYGQISVSSELFVENPWAIKTVLTDFNNG